MEKIVPDPHPAAILFGAFGIVILFYAIIVYWTQDIGLIPRSEQVDIKNEKEYARKFAKVMMVVALVPLVIAYIFMFGEKWGAFAFVSGAIGLFVCIDFGIKRFFSNQEESKEAVESADESQESDVKDDG